MWWYIAGFTGLALVSWAGFSARRMLHPERFPVPHPSPVPPYTVHPLIAADGQPFDVWLMEAAHPRGRVVLFHGFFANRFQVLDIAESLRRHHYEVLMLELRGHGARPGPCTFGLRETEDALTALAWAANRTPGASAVPLAVMGLSIGGAMACQLAARAEGVRAVVVDSVFSRLYPVVQRTIWLRYRLPAVPWAWLTWITVQAVLGRRLDRLDPVALAPGLRQPLLAIQGGEDRRVAPLLGRAFYQAWAGPKERWFEPHVAHVRMFASHPAAYGRRVADFLDRALGGSIVG